jgi:protein-disulfide isomerase
MRILKGSTLLILPAVALAVTACAPPDNSAELAEISQQQKQILAKLADMEKKLETARAPQAPPQRPTGPDPDKAYDLPVAGSPIMGPEDGSITIVEFSDYQCPFCARAEPIIHQALEAYPQQARFVYKHFPLESIHPQAMAAAKAAVAAQKQGKFWEMHEILFSNQRALQDDKLVEYAKQLGLDVAKFEADMKSEEVQNQVRDDMRLARIAGVRGTPTIFVNGKLLRNRSIEGFKEMIDPMLKEKAEG